MIKRGAAGASLFMLIAVVFFACMTPYSIPLAATSTPIEVDSLFATGIYETPGFAGFGTGTALALSGTSEAIAIQTIEGFHPLPPSHPPFPSATPVSLPEFPWPVPKPSAWEVVPLGSLGQLAGTGITYHDVDERISGALDGAGYHERSYFGAPNGFAIVTRLEMMDNIGYPAFPNRWASSLAPVRLVDFSLATYLQALFMAPEGHYRVFVFMVTSEIVVQSGTAVAQAEAQNWIVEGANKLPSYMEELPYTRNHTTTAYIYEFIQLGVGADANQNIPSNFTGRQHLERAGLWESLNADTSPPSVVLLSANYASTGEGCYAVISFQVSGSAATGQFRVWNQWFTENGLPYDPGYPVVTMPVGTNTFQVSLGGTGNAAYYRHKVWFEFNGKSSNVLENLVCPGLTPAP